MQTSNDTSAPPSSFSRQLLTAAVAVAAALSTGACDDDLLSRPEGARISGHVFYDGSGYSGFSSPSLQVGAFGIFPPGGPPHALRVVPDPEFAAEGIAYELRGLPAFDGYHVVGQIVDRDDATVTNGPSGAFPSFCQLSDSSGVVAVTDAAPTTGIDITLFDSGGAADPCSNVSDECPVEPDKASMVLDLTSELDPATFTEADTGVVALFTVFPGPPSSFRLLPRAQLEFPNRVILNDVTPGSYIVYACYDKGGDDSMGVCEEGEDTFAFFEDQAYVTFEAGTITTLELDLDTGASEPAQMTIAQDAGCLP